jgi:hypothetical protein
MRTKSRVISTHRWSEYVNYCKLTHHASFVFGESPFLGATAGTGTGGTPDVQGIAGTPGISRKSSRTYHTKISAALGSEKFMRRFWRLYINKMICEAAGKKQHVVWSKDVRLLGKNQVCCKPFHLARLESLSSTQTGLRTLRYSACWVSRNVEVTISGRSDQSKSKAPKGPENSSTIQATQRLAKWMSIFGAGNELQLESGRPGRSTALFIEAKSCSWIPPGMVT